MTTAPIDPDPDGDGSMMRLIGALVFAGGIEVQTGRGGRILVSSMVQPDGDLIVRADPAALGDAALLTEHGARLRHRLSRLTAAMHQAHRWQRIAVVAIRVAGIGPVVAGGGVVSLTEIAVVELAPVMLAGIGLLVMARAAGAPLRRAVHRRLQRRGALQGEACSEEDLKPTRRAPPPA